MTEKSFYVRDEYANREIPLHIVKIPFEGSNFEELDRNLKSEFEDYLAIKTDDKISVVQ